MRSTYGERIAARAAPEPPASSHENAILPQTLHISGVHPSLPPRFAKIPPVHISSIHRRSQKSQAFRMHSQDASEMRSPPNENGAQDGEPATVGSSLRWRTKHGSRISHFGGYPQKEIEPPDPSSTSIGTSCGRQGKKRLAVIIPLNGEDRVRGERDASEAIREKAGRRTRRLAARPWRVAAPAPAHTSTSPPPSPPLPTVGVNHHARAYAAPRNGRWDMRRKGGQKEGVGLKRAGGRGRRAQVQEGGVQRGVEDPSAVYRRGEESSAEKQRRRAIRASQGRHCPRRERAAEGGGGQGASYREYGSGMEMGPAAKAKTQPKTQPLAAWSCGYAGRAGMRASCRAPIETHSTTKSIRWPWTADPTPHVQARVRLMGDKGDTAAEMEMERSARARTSMLGGGVYAA
ncbi:hypothetical protein B0H14DRAFT_2630161 [Mycena olivaceomarginata]|nr:hypothetical protein B0H14DRAFT_2630161 [Mycena olivaceomarginata]